MPSSNPVLWAATLAALACSAFAYRKLRWALPILFVWIAFADLLKRLLFLGAAAPPTDLDYFWMLALPDLVMAAAMCRVGTDLLKMRRLEWRPGLLDYLVAAFFLWSALELFNPTFPLTVRLAGFKSSSIYILVYFLVRTLEQQDREWLPRLVPFLAGTSIVAALYGLYQGQFGFAEFELQWLESGLTQLGGGVKGQLGETIAWFGIVRPFSIFASHEQLGWYLSFAVLVILIHWERRPIRWILVALLLIAVARTLSRSAWVFMGGSAGMLAVAALLARRKGLARTAVVALILMVAAIGLWTLLDSQTTLGQGAIPPAAEPTARGAENPYLQRATVLGSYEWRIFSFQQFLSNPEWHRLLGNGIGSMWVAWRLKAPGTLNPDERILSHIGSVDIVYELGLVGGLIFAAMVVTIVWAGWRLYASSSLGNLAPAAFLGIAVVLATVAANSLVTTVLMFRPIAVPFWLSMGMAGASLYPTPRSAALGLEPKGPDG